MSNAKKENGEDLDEDLSNWETEELLKVLTAEDDILEDREISSIEAELRRRNVPLPSKCPVCSLINPPPITVCPSCGYDFTKRVDVTTLVPDEQVCPRCNEIVKKDAKKCPKCSYVFDPELRTQQIMRNAELQIQKTANKALRWSLIGLSFSGVFVMLSLLYSNFSGFITLVPGFFFIVAVSQGMDALTSLRELHEEYPHYKIDFSIKAKALIGTIIGATVLLLVLIDVLIAIRTLFQ